MQFSMKAASFIRAGGTRRRPPKASLVRPLVWLWVMRGVERERDGERERWRERERDVEVVSACSERSSHDLFSESQSFGELQLGHRAYTISHRGYMQPGNTEKRPGPI
ncbi:hypothetical protein NL108_015297 [Boleophthalmus pectinirostris]|nr:hypothetical protein NL108_015297 [Boleophthalmus pectinirostris]